MRTAHVVTLSLALAAFEGSLLGPRVERPVDPNLPEGAPRELASVSSRAARLSHVEYENTARDLLGAQQSPGVTGAFVPDIDIDQMGAGHLSESVTALGADVVHSNGYTGQGVTVAVLDTGIDTDHLDLSDDLVAQHCFTDSQWQPWIPG